MNSDSYLTINAFNAKLRRVFAEKFNFMRRLDCFKWCRVALFLVVFGVTIARDGAQARKLLRSSRPDLVVLDVAKPGLGGLAALRWIRNQRRPHQTTVRMLTALAHSAQMRSVA